MAWSYDLLTAGAQAVLRQAGVFAGGCDLEALAAVATGGSDPLPAAADLLDVSMVTVTEGADAEPRVSLPGPVREYALERLAEAGELAGTRERHAAYYAGFAERWCVQLYGPAHLAAMDRIEADYANLRAVLGWSLEQPARTGYVLRLLRALAPLWYQRGQAGEGRRWLQRALEAVSGPGGAPFAGIAHALAVMLDQQGEREAALPLAEQSLAVWRGLGERLEEARVLNTMGIIRRDLGDGAAARSLLEQSISIGREQGDRGFGYIAALLNLGQAENAAGNVSRADGLQREALAVAREQGDTYLAAHARHYLAETCLRAGRTAEARDLLAASLDFTASSGSAELVATILELSACVAAAGGDPLAERLRGAAESVRDEAGLVIMPSRAVLLDQLMPAGPDRQAGRAAGRELAAAEALALLRSAVF